MNDKRISLTIDDLPFVSMGVSLHEIEEATARIHGHLEKCGISAVGFVIGQEVSDDRRSSILKSWQDKGHFLGNHTFSHLSLSKVLLEIFIEDVEKNERILDAFWNAASYKERYFRLPYLQRGNTEKYNGIKAFLSQRPYTLVPVTVNSFDFIFNAVFVHAYKNKDKSAVKNVISAYLAHIEALLQYHQRAMSNKIGRAIDHILLLHANLLNACCLDKVAAVLAKNGYRIPPLQETLNDPFYQDFSKWNAEDQRHFEQWWKEKGINNEIEPLPGIDAAVLESYRRFVRH